MYVCIDADYRGNVVLFNHGKEDLVISGVIVLAQLVMEHITKSMLMLLTVALAVQYCMHSRYTRMHVCVVHTYIHTPLHIVLCKVTKIVNSSVYHYHTHVRVESFKSEHYYS